MNRESGLGLLDRAILDALELLGAGPRRPYVKTQRVLDVVYEATGIGPRLSYEPLCTLARPWVLYLLLVDFHGNVGSPDFGPASARYTESRLTPLGAAALAAERRTAAAIPIALVNGDLHVGGTRPPLDPLGTLAALRAAAGDATDDELVALVGRPSFPTGCRVDVDLDAFAAGHETTLVATGNLSQDGDRYVVSGLPPDSSASELAASIQHRLTWPGPVGQGPSVPPIADVHDDSTANDTRLTIVTRPGTASEEIAAFHGTLWHFRRTLRIDLGEPLAQLIRAACSATSAEQLAMIEASVRERA